MSRPNNIRPESAAKFLQEKGWKLFNIKGSHWTFVKEVEGRNMFCQVIANDKTIHWKNAKIMIKKSGIPEKEWPKK